VPMELSCLDCERRFHPGRDDYACPACGGARVQIAAGEEFYLEAIDVEGTTE
jgi:Zn finger protein HypA/HybF involved in hydrogenase expression